MAWYNIIDNTSEAFVNRKQCKEMEISAKKYIDDTKTLSDESLNRITTWEEKYREAFDKFKTSSSDIWQLIRKFEQVECTNDNPLLVDESVGVSSNSVKKGDFSVFNLESLALASSGGIAAMGAFTAVGIFGTASTGTAIGSLTGIYASNATLAWFGGGALAAGGGGMAAGTLVLGSIVAAPILFAAADQANKYYEKNRRATEKYLSDATNAHQVGVKAQQRIHLIAARIRSKVDFLEYISTQYRLQQGIIAELFQECNGTLESQNHSNVFTCCLENVRNSEQEALRVLSTPLFEADGPLSAPIKVELYEVIPLVTKTNWTV